jgi:hypothetical protein
VFFEGRAVTRSRLNLLAALSLLLCVVLLPSLLVGANSLKTRSTKNSRPASPGPGEKSGPIPILSDAAATPGATAETHANASANRFTVPLRLDFTRP